MTVSVLATLGLIDAVEAEEEEEAAGIGCIFRQESQHCLSFFPSEVPFPSSQPFSLSVPSKLDASLSSENSYTFSLLSSGIRKSSFSPHLQPGGRKLRRDFPKNMACGLDNKTGTALFRPATDAYTPEAVEALRAGKVIAVPTDTLYGFACDACSLEAVNRIYEIKGRKHTSPLAICVGDVSDIYRYAVTNHLPHGLLDSLLPGPVTVVLSRGDSSVLEQSLNPGFDSIGVRVPDNNFIRVIARGSGTALALTSANLSGQPSSVCIRDFENLWEHCAFVYDGGVLPSGRAGSTVVDLTTPHKYKILRPGSAKEETIAILEKHSLVESAAQ